MEANMLKNDGKTRQKGFTLAESMISLVISGIFLTTVLTAWSLYSRVWNEQNVKSELRYDIEKAMELIKQGVRLADGNGIVFYPANGADFTALSLPHMKPDSNGFLGVSSNSINWGQGQTIIYYTYNTSKGQELRQTVFNSFDTNTANRQTQLNSVVTTGAAQGATTTTLFSAPTVTLDASSTVPVFDGYGASTQLSGNTSFGSIRLSSGNHQIQFQVTGKNSASSGYKIGIDALSLTPSGCSQEAEALTISGNSGKSSTVEDMSSYEGWGGNYQVEYQASTVGDYITFQTNYDQWLESNFEDMTHSNTEVGGTNPYLTIKSRENTSLVPSWQASAQTGAENELSAMIANKSVRTIVFGNNIGLSAPAQMARIRFTAPAGGSLTINSAYFGVKGPGSDFDQSTNPMHQLYFSNPSVAEGSADGVGAVGDAGPTSVTLAAGSHVWSNWFVYPINSSSNYLISFSISADPNLANMAAWTPSDLTQVNSYLADGDHANEAAAWPATPPYNATTDPSIYAAAQLAAWIDNGTATSQVYDTKMATPAYSQLSWSSSLPAGSSVSLKVRTASDPTMAGATNWSALSAYAGSPASLNGLSNLEYIQFQATLQAVSPYTTLPTFDNVKITWPGQTALVELSGKFTKRPNYGIFKVLIDGQAITKALAVKLTAQNTYRGKSYTYSLNAEVRPKNTGK